MRSQLKWAGHVDRMEGVRLATRERMHLEWRAEGEEEDRD